MAEAVGERGWFLPSGWVASRSGRRVMGRGWVRRVAEQWDALVLAHAAPPAYAPHSSPPSVPVSAWGVPEGRGACACTPGLFQSISRLPPPASLPAK